MPKTTYSTTMIETINMLHYGTMNYAIKRIIRGWWIPTMGYPVRESTMQGLINRGAVETYKENGEERARLREGFRL